MNTKYNCGKVVLDLICWRVSIHDYAHFREYNNSMFLLIVVVYNYTLYIHVLSNLNQQTAVKSLAKETHVHALTIKYYLHFIWNLSYV